jgi:hypothetical protein
MGMPLYASDFTARNLCRGRLRICHLPIPRIFKFCYGSLRFLLISGSKDGWAINRQVLRSISRDVDHDTLYRHARLNLTFVG